MLGDLFKVTQLVRVSLSQDQIFDSVEGVNSFPTLKPYIYLGPLFHWNHYPSALCNLDFLKSTPAFNKIIKGSIFTIPNAE